MLFPTADQYADLIENKATGTFYVLNDYNFLFKGEGKTIHNYKQGYSTVIFKAEKNGHPFAIRCFLSGDAETFRRYEPVCRYINSRNLSWKTSCEFLDKEVRINGEQYPVVKMEWKKGSQLNDFIDQIVSDAARLSKLQQDLVALSINLEENSIGHGDLNFSHIMISGDVTDFSITLLDYDSLYIADFEGQNSLVSGSPGFQHPLRLSSDFSEKIDRFSIWIMLAGLEAIKMDPQLWIQPELLGYDKKENLLFTFRDLINPERSRLFQQLKTYKSEALQYYLQHIETFCSSSTLDDITKPELNKTQSKHFIYQEIKKSSALPAEKLFDVEIKTIPAGKDVLVNGTKKGITPLRIAIAKKDFGHVEVMNAYEKTPLVISEQKQTYEIDFLKKQKENIPEKSLTEQNEILDFGADRYLVGEGEIVAIRWKVKGSGKIHIAPIGDVHDQSGSKEFVLKKTTNYILSIGDKNKSFIIHVQPRQGERKQKPEKFTFPVTKRKSFLNRKQILLLLAFLIVAVSIYFMSGYFSKKSPEITPVNQSVPQASPVQSSPFPVTEVTKFLNRLYGAYNQRSLPSIMEQYAGKVNEYYDSKSINKDSLSVIIKNLFITPAFYSCQPDYTQLSIAPNSESCLLELEIMEVLQKEQGSSRDTFNTRIVYIIDKNFHIISEKSAEECGQ